MWQVNLWEETDFFDKHNLCHQQRLTKPSSQKHNDDPRYGKRVVWHSRSQWYQELKTTIVLVQRVRKHEFVRRCWYLNLVGSGQDNFVVFLMCTRKLMSVYLFVHVYRYSGKHKKVVLKKLEISRRNRWWRWGHIPVAKTTQKKSPAYLRYVLVTHTSVSSCDIVMGHCLFLVIYYSG